MGKDKHTKKINGMNFGVPVKNILIIKYIIPSIEGIRGSIRRSTEYIQASIDGR